MFGNYSECDDVNRMVKRAMGVVVVLLVQYNGWTRWWWQRDNVDHHNGSSDIWPFEHYWQLNGVNSSYGLICSWNWYIWYIIGDGGVEKQSDFLNLFFWDNLCLWIRCSYHQCVNHNCLNIFDIARNYCNIMNICLV